MKNELQNILAKLKPPVDYFNGVRMHDALLPNNIISFCNPDVMKTAEAKTRHSRFVLVNNFGEAGTVVLDGRHFRLEGGHFMLLFPFQSHHYLEAHNTGGWLYITFDMEEPQRMGALRNRTVKRSARLDAMLMDYIRLYHDRSDTVPSRNSIALGVAAILEESLRLASETQSESELSGSSHQATIEKLRELIFQRLEEPLPIAFLARKTHMSESNLRRLFRAEFGVSLGRYVRKSKMLHGAKLLTTTDLTVTEIAPLCGFDSVYAFSRAFRQAAGASPLKYRKARRQDNRP